MGILNAVGVDNGFSNWWDQHRNAITNFGAGLAGGPTFSQGLAAGSRGLAAGSQADTAYVASRKAEAERQAQLNETAKYLQSNPAFADLVPLVAAGQAGPALQEAFSRMKGNAPKDLLQLSPGEVAFDPNTNTPVYTAPTAEKPPSLPSSYQEYQLAQNDPGYAASLSSSSTKPPTTDQSNAAGFADRMAAAEPILQQTEAVQADQGQALKNMVPGVGNYLVSPEYQQALQAQRDFINAQLRKESGAAISPAEFESAQKQYFPQPGDSPIVIEQKRQNRAIAIEAMKRTAGTALARSKAGNAGNVTSSGVQWSVSP